MFRALWKHGIPRSHRSGGSIDILSPVILSEANAKQSRSRRTPYLPEVPRTQKGVSTSAPGC
jgi:hypothetical protein